MAGQSVVNEVPGHGTKTSIDIVKEWKVEMERLTSELASPEYRRTLAALQDKSPQKYDNWAMSARVHTDLMSSTVKTLEKYGLVDKGSNGYIINERGVQILEALNYLHETVRKIV